MIKVCFDFPATILNHILPLKLRSLQKCNHYCCVFFSRCFIYHLGVGGPWEASILAQPWRHNSTTASCQFAVVIISENRFLSPSLVSFFAVLFIFSPPFCFDCQTQSVKNLSHLFITHTQIFLSDVSAAPTHKSRSVIFLTLVLLAKISADLVKEEDHEEEQAKNTSLDLTRVYAPETVRKVYIHYREHVCVNASYSKSLKNRFQKARQDLVYPLVMLQNVHTNTHSHVKSDLSAAAWRRKIIVISGFGSKQSETAN